MNFIHFKSCFVHRLRIISKRKRSTQHTVLSQEHYR